MPNANQDQNQEQDQDRSASDDVNPGDIAPPGTPGTGEDVCTHCNGVGTMPDGQVCPMCAGSGVVIAGIGGG